MYANQVRYILYIYFSDLNKSEKSSLKVLLLLISIYESFLFDRTINVGLTD